MHSGVPHLPPADWSGVRAVLLRPDGHIAWAGTDHDAAALADELAEALAAHVPGVRAGAVPGGLAEPSVA
ncbi:hypothetical protein ACFV6E_31220 [Streptomyces sp. NPDC059785]|uniref:aromatic-ring hydroxylase C-terminal domain-containing protein n=1 Tax=unclassified Streptomyces TaxID=2593676 RepID=UPI003664D239